MAITSKGKGKSGGARIITYLVVSQEIVYLLSVYDKTEKENLTDKELLELLKNVPDERTFGYSAIETARSYFKTEK